MAEKQLVLSFFADEPAADAAAQALKDLSKEGGSSSHPTRLLVMAEPPQIDAIVAYLKTIPAPAP